MQIIMPWKNLGCLAIKTENFYGDVFLRPYFGFYWHWKGKRHWFRVRTMHHHSH